VKSVIRHCTPFSHIEGKQALILAKPARTREEINRNAKSLTSLTSLTAPDELGGANA
jgi:hypothetical protein